MLIATVLFLVTLAIAATGYTYGEKPDSNYVTAPVERGKITTVVKATGIVNPVVMVDVGSQLSGEISQVLVNYNDTVKAGEVIARVKPDSYIAAVNGAKADLRIAEATKQQQDAALQAAKVAVDNAHTARKLAETQLKAAQIQQKQIENDFKRNLMLAKTKAVSEQVLSQSQSLVNVGVANLEGLQVQLKMKSEAIDAANAQLSMAEANVRSAAAVVEQKQAAVDQAEVNLQQTKIRSPIDGIVIRRVINSGQTVAVSLESKTLFIIADNLDQMQVQGSIDEADIGQIKVGQPATFVVDAYPHKVFSGRVLQIRKFPEVNDNVVTYTTIISARNPGHLLFPGMTARLKIVVAETKATLKIPTRALYFRPKGYKSSGSERVAANEATVWVASGPEALPVRVTVGKSDNTGTQLLSGSVTAGQRVIVGQTPGTKRSLLFGIW